MDTNNRRVFLRVCLCFLLSMVLLLMPVSALSADTAAADDELSFEHMLGQLREEFFAHNIQRRSGGLNQVFIDKSNVEHEQPEYIPVELDSRAGITTFSIYNYIEGSRRDFMIRNTQNVRVSAPGTLIKQGNHVNIWVVDIGVQTNPAPDITQFLDDMAERFDGIFARMTEDFGAFKGIRIATPFLSNMPVVGDIHEDGRVNVLLYNIGDKAPAGLSSYTAGFFTNAEFMTDNGNVPIALVHMDIAQGYGYNALASADSLSFYDTYAHEFQHLLFYMHFGVYLEWVPALPLRPQYSWFNESLSELAGTFYTEEGTEVVSVGRMFDAAVNSYANQSSPLNAGDLVNFNNSLKNYGMVRLHSTFMHRATSAMYAGDVYGFFGTTLPPADNMAQWYRNCDLIGESSMAETIGNAYYHAGLTGSTEAKGELAFNLLYVLFMENFAADGGNVITDSGAHATSKFMQNRFTAYNLWGIRPNLGTPTSVYFGVAGYGYSLANRVPLPAISSGGNISLTGFNTTPPLGATHESFHRLVGGGTDNPILSISISDSNPKTRYYVVIPNDALGTSAASNFYGEHGATVYPLRADNAVNTINTGGKAAYLFVATLYRNVNETVVYSWGNSGSSEHSVSGSIRSYNPGNPTTITLTHDSDGFQYTATIAATTGSGQITQGFEITGVKAGTYTMVVTKAVHTTFIVRNITVNEDLILSQHSRSEIQIMTMLCGDINGDGEIGPADLNILRSSNNYMRRTIEALNPAADLNGDGEIGPADLNILRSSINYMKGAVIESYD